MLQKAPVSVPLGGGLDTKTSDALIMPARLSRLENCVFTRAGELQKRPGFDALPSLGWDRSASGDFKGALSVFDEELLVAGGGSVRSYSQVARSWISKGALRSPSVQAGGVYSDQYEQTYADCATLNGVTLYAFESSAGGLYASVVDEQTGARIVPSALVDANGSKPVVVACGNRIFIFYLHTAAGPNYGIKFTRISVGAPGTFSTPSAIVADGNMPVDGRYFSVKPFLGEMVLAYQNVDNYIHVAYVTRDGAIGTPADGHPPEDSSSIVCGTTCGGVGITISGNAFMVLWIDDGDAKAAAFDQQLAVLRAAGTLAVDAAVNITGAPDPSGGIRVFFEDGPTSGDPNYNALVKTCLVPLGSGSVTGLGVLRRSVGLATEAFVQDGVPMVGVVYDSTTQGTVFFIDSSGLVVVKALSGSAGGRLASPRLPSVQSLSTGRWLAALSSKQPEQAGPGNVVSTPKTFSKLVLDFSAPRFRSRQLGRNQHLCGGVVNGYDGTSLFEAGFHVFPERCSVAGQEWALSYSHGAPSDAISINLTPPPDITSGTTTLFSGARIRPGSYIILWPNDGARNYFWFKVDGIGSDPQPFGGSDVTGIRCDLLSSDTQKEVAQKLAASLRSYAFSGATVLWSATVNVSNVVTAVPSAAVSISSTDYTYPPEEEGTFAILATHYGASGSAEKTVIVCPAGKWISGGQWFYLESSRRDTSIPNNSMRAFYFTVDGHGSAPSVPDFQQNTTLNADLSVTVPIPINSTDTPAQVAAAVVTAVGGAQRASLSLFSASLEATGSCAVIVSCVANTAGGYGTVATHAYNHDVASPLVVGNRLYYAMYRWTDAQGQLHRSAPSEAFHSITGAAGGGANVVGVPTYRLGRRSPTAVFVDVYRTDASGQVPRRVKSLTNSASVDSLSFLDDVTDADLQSAEPLYTTGGELENIAPPPTSFVGLHGDRLWVIDENSLLWFSKPFAAGYAVAWSDLLTMRVDRGAGDPVAVVTLDEKGIIFKTDSILAFTGDGPDNTGGGAGFTTPQVISSDVGCISPESLVLTPAGWLFQSKKGIYQLDRSLQVTYLGAPVQEFNSQDITSATLMPSVSQVRFTTSAGLSLFFDYVMQQWGGNTYQARHALLWGDSYVRLGADGVVRQETPGAFVEESGAVRMLARTSWLKLADVQGYGRVYKALLLGRYLSKHKVLVGLEYDYDDTLSEQLSFDAGAVLGGNTYGSGSTYGADDPFGGVVGSGVEQLDIRPSLQKCEAIRLTFSDDPTDSGESLAFVHLQLIVGVKNAGFKRARVVGA